MTESVSVDPEELEQDLRERRDDAEFMARIQRRVIEDKPILDRLSAAEVPCPSIALAVLRAVAPEGVSLQCCLLAGHNRNHRFEMSWVDPEEQR